MRQIVLDTETTGLEPAEGHRIIEIGCVELQDRRMTGENRQWFINPEREVDEGAMAVHGITNEFLADKPRFVDIAQEFLDFIRDAELVIHNAPFDVGFLDAEIKRLGDHAGRITNHAGVLDTLDLARRRHPGMKNSLDALCKRYEVDNSGRTVHGALLDAELLAEVYLALTGGQTSLTFQSSQAAQHAQELADGVSESLPEVRVIRATEEELARHEKHLEEIRGTAGKCVWDEVLGK